MDEVTATVRSEWRERLALGAVAVAIAAAGIGGVTGRPPVLDLLDATACSDPLPAACLDLLPDWAAGVPTPERYAAWRRFDVYQRVRAQLPPDLQARDLQRVSLAESPIETFRAVDRSPWWSPDQALQALSAERDWSDPPALGACADAACVAAMGAVRQVAPEIEVAGVRLGRARNEVWPSLADPTPLNEDRRRAWAADRAEWQLGWELAVGLLACALGLGILGLSYRPKTVVVGLHAVHLGDRRFLWEDVEAFAWQDGPPLLVSRGRVHRLAGYGLAPADAERLREASELAMAHARTGAANPAALAELRALAARPPERG